MEIAFFDKIYRFSCIKNRGVGVIKKNTVIRNEADAVELDPQPRALEAETIRQDTSLMTMQVCGDSGQSGAGRIGRGKGRGFLSLVSSGVTHMETIPNTRASTNMGGTNLTNCIPGDRLRVHFGRQHCHW